MLLPPTARSLVVKGIRSARPALVLAVVLSVASLAPVAIAFHTDRAGPGPSAYLASSSDTHQRQARPADGRPASFAHESIIGGTVAQVGAFPSLAYIVDFQGQFAYQCTGTVIAPSLILTAGHCAENMQTGVANSPSGYRVVTGAIDPLLPGEPVSTVLGVIVYPGLVRNVDEGDVALLVLSAPTTAPPIGLANTSTAKRLVAGATATIVGWGKTAYDQTTLTEQLQSAATVVQRRKWCRRNAPPFYPRSEICTITAPSYSTGVCEGDSGGPLLALGPSGEAVEVGVADHVYGRCSTRRPSVFASVGSISSWIHTWIEAYKLAPTPPTPTPPTTLPSSPSPQPAPS
jgi:secreted trypsin-like serine protease